MVQRMGEGAPAGDWAPARAGGGRPLCLCLCAIAAALAGLLLLPAVASAAFHLIKVREVYPGTSNDSYVVLQMYSAGEQFVEGRSVTLYSPTGTVLNTSTFPSSVPNGANQQTILVGDSGAQAAFGVTPDLTDAGLNISAGGGAVCWASIYDCMSWGNFSGSTSSPTGSPADAFGVPVGMALSRTIEPGCPTLLEAGDDTHDSATDFLDAAPNPRNNASAIVETKCVAPETAIDAGPADPTSSTDASFEFSAIPPEEATFQCRLDDELSFTACVSPKEYSALAEGSHTFRVRAVHPTNGTGTPATYVWTIDLTPPTATILEKPPAVSPETSASFTYKSSEVGSTFECSRAIVGEPDAFSACPLGGESYEGLEDMATHIFKVRATDKAGNQGEPDEYKWEVDGSAVDETPPQTTILSRPPNPSASSTAFFTYASSEPGSTFECSLDAPTFAACPAIGIAYTGLANGTHTFRVRARDESENVDPFPAGYTFDVVLATAPPGPLPPPPPPPQAEPEPGTAFAAGVALVKGASALLEVGCRGTQGARCNGVLRLLASVGTARSSRRAARNLTIGRTRYSLPAGSRSRIVRVRLSGRGRQLVRRAGKGGLRVRLVGRGLKSRVLTLRVASGKTRADRRRSGPRGAKG